MILQNMTWYWSPLYICGFDSLTKNQRFSAPKFLFVYFMQIYSFLPVKEVSMHRAIYALFIGRVYRSCLSQLCQGGYMDNLLGYVKGAYLK